jgi:hypothetical protein
MIRCEHKLPVLLRTTSYPSFVQAHNLEKGGSSSYIQSYCCLGRLDSVQYQSTITISVRNNGLGEARGNSDRHRDRLVHPLSNPINCKERSFRQPKQRQHYRIYIIQATALELTLWP